MAFTLPLALVAVVNGALAQQFQQAPLAAAPQPDVQDSLKKINDSLQDVQLKASSVAATQSQQPAAVPTPLIVSGSAISGKVLSSSATWSDNRGSFKLQFPEGQICSFGNSTGTSVENCH